MTQAKKNAKIRYHLVQTQNVVYSQAKQIVDKMNDHTKRSILDQILMEKQDAR